MNINRLAIVGVGLIGGSIGLAARARKIAQSVVGTGSRAATLADAQSIGAITEIAPDLKTAVSGADLVVVCAPVSAIVEQVRQLAPHCRPGTLITDAGSTKAEIVAGIEQASGEKSWPAGVHFVGSHPLAGTEKKGPRHATADLFVGRTVVITPSTTTRGEDRQRVADFWRSLGAETVEMAADEHDRAVSATSHLPHLVASAIASSTPERYVTLTASGWHDTTRIAAGDPVLWRQIMLANRAHLLESLERFEQNLAQWREALDAADGQRLERLLEEAKRIRDAVGN